MKSKTITTLNILKSRGLYFFLILGILSIISDFGFMPVPIIGFMFLYVVYDIIGYESFNYNQKQIESKLTQEEFEKILQSFRINAAMFFYSLFFLLWFRYSIWDAISFWILHRFGLFDYVYHLIGRHPIPEVWTWVGWTPAGWLADKNAQGKKEISNTVMKIQIVCGILIVAVIFIFKWIINNQRM